MEKLLGNIHHVGYLVKNIEKSICVMKSLGFRIIKDKIYDDDRDAYICFIDGNGIIYELIEPCRSSDIYHLLRHFRNMPYHVCYSVDDIETAITKLENKEFVLTQNPARAQAISDKAIVAFMLHSRIGIVELVEE